MTHLIENSEIIRDPNDETYPEKYQRKEASCSEETEQLKMANEFQDKTFNKKFARKSIYLKMLMTGVRSSQ